MDYKNLGQMSDMLLATDKLRTIQGLGLVAGGLALMKAYQGYKRKNYFSNKVVLITGGSRGLGFILAKNLCREGATLILCSRNDEELKKAKREISAGSNSASVTTFVCDVSDRSQVQDMVSRIETDFGRIDVLINNAGIIQVGPMVTMELEDFKKAMDVIYWGTVNTTLSVLPLMRRQRFGHIANVTSIGGAVSVPHLLPYNAAKFAVRGFSEGMTSELRQEGIYVTTIIPGLMRTGSFVHALFKSQRDKEFQWFSLGARLPGLSMNAERAAAQMIEAIANRKSWIVVGASAKLLYSLYKVFTRPTIRTFSWVNKILLPAPAEDQSSKEYQKGLRLKSKLPRRQRLAFGRRPLKKYNQASGF